MVHTTRSCDHTQPSIWCFHGLTKQKGTQHLSQQTAATLEVFNVIFEDALTAKSSLSSACIPDKAPIPKEQKRQAFHLVPRNSLSNEFSVYTSHKSCYRPREFWVALEQRCDMLSVFSKLRGGVTACVNSLLSVPWVVRLIVAIKPLHKRINNAVINRMVNTARYRPHPFSTRSSYTSWSSLTDRSWSGRHLPAAPPSGALPSPELVANLFERKDSEQRLCPKSTCLFPAFAQYLTDGLMRTVPVEHPLTGADDKNNRKRNTSNHEIDLCTLYGRKPKQTEALRETNPTNGCKGLLKSQRIGNEEFPPFLFKDGDWDPQFKKLDPPLGIREILKACDDPDPEIAQNAKDVRDKVFAVGGDRANTVPQVSLINTLWLREHNRLARKLSRNPACENWDDDRVFETVRNIVIVEFIKVVIEDYINHVSTIGLPLKADPSVAWRAPWNKPNRITTEFSLVYRWHSLIPDKIVWGDRSYPVKRSHFLDNRPLIRVGLQRGFEDMSAQKAGLLGPKNTTRDLLEVEISSITHGRFCEVAPYNSYREYLGLPRAKSFADISGDPHVQHDLEQHYGDVDNVEFFVGIFCEDRLKNSPLPETILRFVALDAFSQALTNPLLSEHVFQQASNEEHPTFTKYGMDEIKACKSLSDIVKRNIDDLSTLRFVGMTQQSWKPE